MYGFIISRSMFIIGFEFRIYIVRSVGIEPLKEKHDETKLDLSFHFIYPLCAFILI